MCEGLLHGHAGATVVDVQSDWQFQCHCCCHSSSNCIIIFISAQWAVITANTFHMWLPGALIFLQTWSGPIPCPCFFASPPPKSSYGVWVIDGRMWGYSLGNVSKTCLGPLMGRPEKWLGPHSRSGWQSMHPVMLPSPLDYTDCWHCPHSMQCTAESM